MSISRIGAMSGFVSATQHKPKVHPQNHQNYSMQSPTFTANPTVKKNSKKNIPLISAAVVAAGIVLVVVAKKFPAIKKAFSKNGALKDESKKITDLILEVKRNSSDEVTKIIGENTKNNMLMLSGMDEAALMRMKDETRKNHLHEAANMLEESYKTAYQKSEPESGKNMFDKIMNRFENESDALIQVYSKMPEAESSQRAKIFAADIQNADTSKGMKFSAFLEKLENAVSTKRKG